MASQPLTSANNNPNQPLGMPSREMWLRKHSDYQRVYREGKRQSLPLITFFFALRDTCDQDLLPHSRVGLTAGKVLGGAVERNRIKRRMRAVVRRHYGELPIGLDIVLHPRRTVLEIEFSAIERDVQRAFQAANSAVRAGNGESGQR